MILQIPFNLLSRQAALGPPAELGEFFGETPFPFAELAAGLPSGVSPPQPIGAPKEVPEGLKAVGVFGEVIEVPDDDFIKQSRVNTEQRRQELASFIQQDPKNPLLPKMISDFRAGKAGALENEEKLKRNKAQIEELRKEIATGNHNPHDLLEVERAVRDYSLARNANPAVVPDLNIAPLIARIPQKTDRNKIINDNLTKLRDTEILSQEDILSARNARVETIDGTRVLITATGKGVSGGRVLSALEEVFNAPGFMEDVRRQAEAEAETAGASGQTEVVEARVQDILEGHKQRALDTFRRTDISPTIRKIGKEDVTFSRGGAQGKLYNFTRETIPEKKLPAVFPGMFGGFITQGREEIHIAKRQGENPSINVPDGKKDSKDTIKLTPIKFLNDENGEWYLHGEVPANQRIWLPKGATYFGSDGERLETTKTGYIRSQKPLQIVRPWNEVKKKFMVEYDNITVEGLLEGWGEAIQEEPEATAPTVPTFSRDQFKAKGWSDAQIDKAVEAGKIGLK